ncbi:MAG TPA: outer membrane homotrimeric porin, partial [Humidesulfovibrio sp.]|uniref:outer membrane homotrimeric porin n=1 Tax=Humidesulfovibrio sp. TaxID=2910988 RepID=UPI002C7D1279
KDQSFRIEQRMRTAFQFIANENLKAVLDTQIGSNTWGNGMYQVSAGRTPNATTAGGANSAGQGNIMLRQGYIDFKWPNTAVNFKVGFQSLSLPAAFGGGSAIFDDQAGAAVVSAPIVDGVKVLAGYVRPYDANNFGSTAAVQGHGTSADVGFLALPIDYFKGFSIVPFGAFMYAGGQAAAAGTGATSQIGFQSAGVSQGEGTRGYWGGVAFTMTAFEPFKVMADFNYGLATYNNWSLGAPNADKGGRQGWLADIAVDYTGLSMMTPEVYYVYTSGTGDGNGNKDGRMPIMGNPQSWSINNSFYFGDRNMITGFNTTSAGGSNGAGTRNTMGFWATGIALKDIKLIDGFSHTLNVMYAKGTNDADSLKRNRTSGMSSGYGVYLTDKDSLFEIDLQNKYMIYDALSLQLDLGYINANIDKDTWRVVNANYGNNEMLTSNAYRAALGLTYSF